MTMNSELFTNPKELAEAKLMSAGKYSILAAQISGYLPLSRVNGKLVISYNLKFALQRLFGFLHVLNWAYLAYTIELNNANEKRLFFFTHTEFLVVVFSGAVSSTTYYVLLAYGLLSMKSTLSFWKRNAELLESFQCSPNLNEKLGDIHISQRKLFMRYIGLLSFYYSVIWYLYLTEKKALPDGSLMQTILDFISQMLAILSVSLQPGHGIWLSFFPKFYTALFRHLQEDINNLSQLTEVSLGISKQKLRDMHQALRESYRLYILVDEQVKDFNHHFPKRLVMENFNVFLNILGYAFILISCVAQDRFKPVMLITQGIPIMVYAKYMYEAGTVGSELTLAASSISGELHKFFLARKCELDLAAREQVHVFAIKVETSPPAINAAGYFVLNRELVTTVVSTLTMYLIILIQFRAAEISNPMKNGSEEYYSA